ncbi:MAG: SPOR domain-containing protein, partial [Pseudomonadota bacterium]
PAAAPAPGGAPAQEKTPPPAAREETPVPNLDKFGPATRERLLETRKWLASAGRERWFIQLLAADGEPYDHVESFVARAAKAADSSQVRVYSVELDGTSRVGVIYGDYPSREAALAALAQLPESLKAFGPYARPIRHLRP